MEQNKKNIPFFQEFLKKSPKTVIIEDSKMNKLFIRKENGGKIYETNVF